eukprot:TRINITY_DN2814_c0_g2_i1.p1 TRINITY_DN2814_c0_g2~~TRINITY_DN2814_c0_g2_i1.p1  ORF type:complete len:279 (+),score=55.43 TRINITY_DN2814_c0_g2_i1:315-1151(+)
MVMSWSILRVLFLFPLLAYSASYNINLNQWYESMSVPTDPRHVNLHLGSNGATTRHLFIYPCMGYFNVYVGYNGTATTTSYDDMLPWQDEDIITYEISNTNGDKGDIYLLIEANGTIPDAPCNCSASFSIFYSDIDNTPTPIPANDGLVEVQHTADSNLVKLSWTRRPVSRDSYKVYYMPRSTFPIGTYPLSGCAIKAIMQELSTGITYSRGADNSMEAEIAAPAGASSASFTVLVVDQASRSQTYQMVLVTDIAPPSTTSSSPSTSSSSPSSLTSLK